MRYIVNPESFARYPGFMRAVIIAERIDNAGEHQELFAELRAREQRARETLDDNFRDTPGSRRGRRLFAVWALIRINIRHPSSTL